MSIINEALNKTLPEKWRKLDYHCKGDMDFIYIFHKGYRITTLHVNNASENEIDKACERHQIRLDGGFTEPEGKFLPYD
jgi:hypothetical protein